jgi:hypothetical protein
LHGICHGYHSNPFITLHIITGAAYRRTGRYYAKQGCKITAPARSDKILLHVMTTSYCYRLRADKAVVTQKKTDKTQLWSRSASF